MGIGKKAFTLIEILVVLAILVVVITSTLAIFRASASSWQKGEVRAERYQQARFILERMSKEISSMIPVSSSGPYCLGNGDEFSFIFSTYEAPYSLVEVGYRLEEESQELMRRFQSLTDYDFDTFDEEEVLSEHISMLNFQYYSGTAWQAEWDSRPQGGEEGILPRAVRIEFDIQDRRGTRQETFTTVVMLPVAKRGEE